MADVKKGSVAIPKGSIALNLNPPPAEEEGVTYGGAYIRFECDDEGGSFLVRAYGEATFTDEFGNDRPVVHHEDIDDEGLLPLKAVAAQIIEAYGARVKNRTMDAAYRARQVAQTLPCKFCSHTPEHPAGECKTKGCKCESLPKGGK